MKYKCKLFSPMIWNTLLLTFFGLLCRIIGFFYRIFLSRTIGAEALGLYQLIFPVLTLCFAISSAGILTSVSRYVAEESFYPKRYLWAGLFLSLSLCFLLFLPLYFYAKPIAIYLLGEERLSPLLKILAFTLFPGAIHSIFNGYYYGQKKTAIPAVSQLVEQVARVFFVVLCYYIGLQNGKTLTVSHGVWGLFVGECFATLTCLSTMQLENRKPSLRLLITSCHTLLGMAIPLTLNQALVHIFQTVENALIPRQLCLFGYSKIEAFRIYGVLSGMVMSILFFPCVLTNSFSVLLLPSIAKANSQKDPKRIRRYVFLALSCGVLLGGLFCAFFLIYGKTLGNLLFSNALAGRLICRLSFLCPMLYTYTLLSSILHGLGHAKSVLFLNLLSALVRISLLLLLVPRFGLNALLWSMLIGQIFSATAALYLVLLFLDSL